MAATLYLQCSDGELWFRGELFGAKKSVSGEIGLFHSLVRAFSVLLLQLMKQVFSRNYCLIKIIFFVLGINRKKNFSFSNWYGWV